MASVGFKEPEKPHKASLNFSLPLDSMDEGDDDLTQRIEDFKYHNPDDVDELRKCIQEVLSEAEKTVQERLDRKAVSHNMKPVVNFHSFYISLFISILHIHTHTRKM